MKILFLNTLHPAKDTRLFYKESFSLIDAGNSVTIIGPYNDKERTIDQVTIIGIGKHKNRAFTLFFLFKTAIFQRTDVIQCNELDSWLIGIIIGKIRKVPVIFDAHEFYPSRFDKKIPELFNSLLEKFIKLYMKVLSLYSKRIITVSEIIKEKYHFLSCEVDVIHNYSNSNIFNINRSLHNSFYPVLIHIGLISIAKGLRTIVNGMALLKKDYPNIHCIFVGKNDDTLKNQELIKKLITDLNIKNNLTFIEWIPHSEIPDYLIQATIGLIMFDITIQNNKMGLPRKFFEYLHAGLPVIVPDDCNLGTIVKKYRLGMTVNPNSDQHFSNSVQKLLLAINNNNISREHIKNISTKHFSWNKEKIKYINVYNSINKRYN